MTTQKPTEKSTPPYAAYTTFINFTNGLKGTPPNVIDRSVMVTMSNASKTQIMSALKYLRLIDDLNRAQPAYKRLISSEGEERKKELQSILKAAYPYLFDGSGGFDLSSATSNQLNKKFEDAGASGDTISKCVSFFLKAAHDAGLALSPYFKKRSSGGGRTQTPRTRKVKQRDVQSEDEVLDEVPDDEPGGGKSSKLELAQQMLERFDPTWPAETQQNYMKFAEQLMNMVTDSDE